MTRDTVKRFGLSSGSTSAAKLIPYTAELQAEFRRAIAPWICDLARGNPGLLGGASYWSITPVNGPPIRDTPIPVGFDEDSAHLGGVFSRLVDATLAVPGAVCRIQDIDLFRRVTLLFLLRRRNLLAPELGRAGVLGEIEKPVHK